MKRHLRALAASLVFAACAGADSTAEPCNATSCTGCHQIAVTGTGSQVSELRAGHFTGGNFVDHPGGSPMSERAIDAVIQEIELAGADVRTFRPSTSTMGNGVVDEDMSNGNSLAAFDTVVDLEDVPAADTAGQRCAR